MLKKMSHKEISPEISPEISQGDLTKRSHNGDI
jgi:hypothetical protein